jgi:hypothetical protein
MFTLISDVNVQYHAMCFYVTKMSWGAFPFSGCGVRNRSSGLIKWSVNLGVKQFSLRSDRFTVLCSGMENARA